MSDVRQVPWGVRAGCAAAVLLAAAAGALANVGDPKSWKPSFDKSFQAPPPADAEARAKGFAERNSKANLERLANEFFALVDLAKVPEAVRTALAKGDHEAALNAYRDFFMNRLAAFSPDEKVNPGVRPRQPPFPFEKAYLHTADDLLANTFIFGMIDGAMPPDAKGAQGYYDFCNKPETQAQKGNVRITFGEPGRANWTWQPDGFTPLGFPHLPFDKGFVSAACGRPHCFTALLVKYIETKDAKYWDKWVAFMDDICLHWRRDTMRAGLNPSHNLNNIEFFTDGTWANLAYLAQNSPEMVKAIPAPTLVRMLNRMWMEYMSDAIQYGRNLSTARRIMFDTFHGVRLATSFPEFRASEYCVRESVRALESLTMLSIMPDGCDVHDTRNYNKGTPEYLRKVYTMLQGSGHAPPWVNEAWFQEQYETMKLHASFIIRELYATGDYPHWGLFHPETGVFVGKDPQLKRVVPEAFEDSDNAKILSNIFEDGKAGAPSFTSDAYPYGGYYMVRTGWGKQDQWLYLPSTRPVSSVTHPDNNNVHLYAYGRMLLANGASQTPVTVDGLDQMHDGNYRASPERYRRDIFRPVYGRAGAANAYRTPLPRRWHTSESFDLVEGEYAGPYARVAPSIFVDDVTHQRQILFARKLGLWVVTDRLKSPTEHAYQWAWPFHCPSGDVAKRYPGFKRSEIAVDARQQAIRTASPDGANLSLYTFAPEPMQPAGLGFKVEKKTAWTVVTALYPRKFDKEGGTVAPDLADVNALKGGLCGFSAAVPGGGRMLYQAAPANGTITLDDITVAGEALLVTLGPDGRRQGVALGCKEMIIGGAKQTIPGTDFEFAVDGKRLGKCEPIYRPMALPVISPAEDRFSDEVRVVLAHNEPSVDVRYTLDGSDPKGHSPLYSAPIALRATTVVKARAFRGGVREVPPTSDGTRASAVVRAVFTKEAAWEPAKVADAKPGLAFTWCEDDGTWPISALALDTMKSAGSGTCTELFDVSATKMTGGGYAFVYTGYLDVPKEGVYSIHAPPEFINPMVHAGYDLRVFLDGKEWYPATRPHNFGAWSVPLKTGKHALKVVYINQQNVHLMSDFENWKDYYWAGTKPGLLMSGPGLAKQPVPAGMLCR